MTVAGLAGAGKSTLARALLSALPPDAPRPVWINCEALGTANGPALWHHLLTQAGAPDAQDQEPTLRRLTSVLAEAGPALLVLDGWEALGSDAAWLVQLLEAVPTLQVLATSRRPLGLPGECLLPLGPLSLTATGSDGMSPAAALFLNRARRLNPRFAYLPEDARAIQKITALVDGLPLAIEIVASLSQLMSCTALAETLSNSLSPVLNETVSGTHSLNSLLQHTVGTLSPAEHAALTALSLFEGTFTREAALAVATTDLRTLGGLINRSLLLRGENDRYRLHALVRTFVRTADGADDADSQRRYVAFFLRGIARAVLAREAPGVAPDDIAEMWRAAQIAVRTKAYAEINIVLDALLQRFPSTSGGSRAAADLIARLGDETAAETDPGPVPHFRIRLAVIEACLRNAIGQFERTEAILDQYTLAEGDDSPAALRLRSQIEFLRATGQWARGDQNGALERFERAEVLASAAGEKTLETLSRTRVMFMRYKSRNAADPASALDQAVTRVSALGIDDVTVEYLVERGVIASDEGDQATARRYIEEAITRGRQHQSEAGTRGGRCALGLVLARSGELLKALDVQREARDGFESSEEWYMAARAERYLAWQYQVLGQREHLLEADLREHRAALRVGVHRHSGWVSLTRSQDALGRGELSEAKAHLISAINTGTAHQDAALESQATAALAEVNLAFDNLPEARALVRRAFQLAARTHQTAGLVWAMIADLRLAIHTEDQARAETLALALIERLDRHGLQMQWRPFDAYLLCHRALQATGNPRARDTLVIAERQLRTVADKLPAGAPREGFLAAHPTLAEITRLHEAMHAHNALILTDRQREVLGLMAIGMTNQNIADHLSISLDTARKHVNLLLAKLGVRNRTGAVHKARQLGLIA